MNKKLLAFLSLMVLILTACSASATASHNISVESDEFRVNRRIVFYNAITDKYILQIEGRCSIDLSREGVLAVTCKIGPDKYQKHYLGLSDNVTYTVEQLETIDVDEYDYKLFFKPEKIVPIDIEYKKGQEG